MATDKEASDALLKVTKETLSLSLSLLPPQSD